MQSLLQHVLQGDCHPGRCERMGTLLGSPLAFSDAACTAEAQPAPHD